MKTIRIEIKNNKAYSLLRDLEALNVIRVIKENEPAVESRHNGLQESYHKNLLMNYQIR